ncbi:MAG: DUF3138 domain-containing protein [Proteobacteria bacterium]|uniref:hypothetical protein n=1 Tax=Aquabacterium sp. TaxID=1872578 RepID=UPI0035C70E1B|nr:DUF3138 domain-containing protein [Pseudomonadota bacterium]
MHFEKKNRLAAAALLALSGAAVQAQPASEVRALKNTVDDLRRQVQELKRTQRPDTDALEKARVEELRKQVEELKAVLKQQQDAKAVAAAQAASQAADGSDTESQEAIEARTAATKADIQGLRTDLENYKYDQSRLQERNIPSVLRNTRIAGTLTLGYQSRSPAFAPGDSQTTAAATASPAETRKNGFRAPTGTLSFSGNLYRDYAEGRNLTYQLGLSVGTTGTNASNNSQVNLTNAFVRYSYEPATGNLEDRLGTVTLGQQAVPFGLDAPALDPEVRAVINNALFVTGLGLDQRQIGLLVSGDYDPYVDFTNNYRAPLLGYSLGFFNGNGPNKSDNNSMRDWIGRVVYTLPVDYTSWFRQLQIGASYTKRFPTIGATALGRRGESSRSGFDVNWTHLPFSVSYEWAYGKDELASITPTNPDGFKRGVGQYINLGYTWGEQFLNSSKQQGKFNDYWPLSYQAFVRVDTFDPDRNQRATKDRQFLTTLGLNIFFAETTRFQINYFKGRNQTPGLSTLANPKRTNGIQAQFVAGF